MHEELKVEFLSEFAWRMKESGYSEKFRQEVIECGVKGYEKQVERDARGECPLHRPKGYKSKERRQKKDMLRSVWYRPNDTVLFCPPTPEGKLAKQLRKVAKETGDKMLMKIKVVERAGTSMKTLLPGLKETECGNSKEQCFIHKNGGKGNCRIEGVVYKSECITCMHKGPSSIPPEKAGQIKKQPGVTSVYIGESSRSGYQRGQDHQKALKNPAKHQNNAFVKHVRDFHRGKGKRVIFKTSVIGQFKRPMQRQISEGINIFRSKPRLDILMNSKMDHYQPVITRVHVTNNVF